MLKLNPESPISVVVPLYNKELYIVEAIESILDQSFLPREIVVIDDGSTDSGPSKVKQLFAAQVSLYRQKNQGVSIARNNGVRLCTSPYIAFLDADDIWLPNHLHSLATIIYNHSNLVFLSTQAAYHFESSSPSHQRSRPRVSLLNSNSFFMAYSRNLKIVTSSSICVRRSSLISIGGFPAGINRGEDVATWIKLAFLGLVAISTDITVNITPNTVNNSSSLHQGEVSCALTYILYLVNSHHATFISRLALRNLFLSISLRSSSYEAFHGRLCSASQYLFLACRNMFILSSILMIFALPICYAIFSLRTIRGNHLR